MLGRLFNLIGAFFNRGMNKLETPEILAEQAQEQIASNLKKMTDAVVASKTQEKVLEKQMQKSGEEITTWEKRAALAVQQNNDELARQCLEKKLAATQLQKESTSQLEQQRATSASLKASLADLREKQAEFATKGQNLVARAKASEAIAKSNELISAPDGSNVDKIEQKIMEKEMRGQALGEMNTAPDEHKFIQMDQQAAMDDELAQLKEQMAGSNDMPRLITTDKTVSEDDKK